MQRSRSSSLFLMLYFTQLLHIDSLAEIYS